MNAFCKVSVVLTMATLSVGCAGITGTVYKQTDGSYKATYASSTEKNVRKVIHSDATITCKKKEGTKNFVVVTENVENIEDTSKKEGFAAVADRTVSLVGKYFGSESVRGELIFNCDK